MLGKATSANSYFLVPQYWKCDFNINLAGTE